MLVVKQSSKGKIVIPQELRDKAKARKGDVWEFAAGDEPNVIIMRKLNHRPNEGLVAALRACPHPLELPPRNREFPRKIKL